MKTLILVGLGLVLTVNNGFANSDTRWYSEAQVQQGKTLFGANCASCHGQNAEATPNWKQTDSNGKYPPPPLNGSAHAWHHDIDQLRRSIREGGLKLGGVMPAFGERLTATEIDSVIAYFQSQWPEETYQRWSGRFKDSKLPSISSLAEPESKAPTQLLLRRIGNLEPDAVKQTTVEGVWQVRIGNRYVYLLDNGKHVIMGDLVNLENGANITEREREFNAVAVLSSFKDEELVVFEADGEALTTLNVFTDTSCPYCQKLHREIGELQAAGIRVRYLPYPRGGSSGPGYQDLKSVWCASDRNQAMTNAKNNQAASLPPGDCAEAAMVDRGYLAGNRLGIQGTPALFTADGKKIEGYRPYNELIPLLLK